MPEKNQLLPIAAALLLLAASWLALRDGGAVASPAVAATSAPAVSTAPAAVAASALAPRAMLAQAARPVDAANDPCRLPVNSVVRKVGGGEQDPAEREAIEAMQVTPAFKSLSASVHRIDEALRTNADPYARAVGVWLNLPRDGSDGSDAPQSQRRRALAAMAVASTDPRIYAMAMRACHWTAEDGCHALNTRRWIQLDAGNALPWFYLLDEASKKGDVSGQEEALFHLASSARLDDWWLTPVPAIVAASNGSPADEMADLALSQIATAISAGQFRPVANTICTRTAPHDANRMQLCLRIADVVFEHADSLPDRQMGAYLTWRLTGDPARKNQVAAEIESATREDVTTHASCDQVHRRMTLMQDVAIHGLAALPRPSSASAPAP